jgi:4-diphosphocytidyl-2-C-methyl-D-erythritol kinase
MDKMFVKAYAKINFFLEIINKRSDGYHNIQTIMQTVNLFDEMQLEIIDEDKIILKCENSDLSNDEKNIVYRAAKAVKSAFEINKGVKILLKKNIPAGAGLGGGSSDAAETIKSLVKMFDIKVSSLIKQKILKIAANLGADVAFFLTGGTSLCESIGDIVTPIKSAGKYYIILVNPNFEIPTADIFKRVRFPLTKKSGIHKINELILDGKLDRKNVAAALFNRLEDFVFPNYPEILKIKTVLSQLGCASLMSGSGATVFGIAENRAHLEYAAAKLQKYPWKIWISSSINAKNPLY